MKKAFGLLIFILRLSKCTSHSFRSKVSLEIERKNEVSAIDKMQEGG